LWKYWKRKKISILNNAIRNDEMGINILKGEVTNGYQNLYNGCFSYWGRACGPPGGHTNQTI
jgi:hypothetical protein